MRQISLVYIICTLDLLGCLRTIYLGWFSCSLFPIQNQSQPTKKYLQWGKSGSNAILNLVFLWLGWPCGGEFVGFIILSSQFAKLSLFW